MGKKGEGVAGGRKADALAQIGVELSLKHSVHLSKVPSAPAASSPHRASNRARAVSKSRAFRMS